MLITQKYLDQLTHEILGAAIEVHRHLGPGLLESAYQKCFVHELNLRGLNCLCQQSVLVKYKDICFESDLPFDVLVEDQIVIELSSNGGIAPVQQFMTLTYMRFLEKAKGIIINFNCTNIFKEGQKTLVNDLYAKLPRE